MDEIKEAVKKGIYGEYNYDQKNNYEAFEIIKDPSFPYKLCDDNGPGSKNHIKLYWNTV